ncbi:MAG: hypothetical protein LUF29_09110 [Oscillospiraceae bacterium]|nr:hypothetical protein [Oscillospiraceae bacterium]
MSRRRLDPEIKAEHVRQQKKSNRKRYYGKTANRYPKRAWTDEEIRLVLEHSIPDSKLSEKIGRSVKGIQEKRRRLKHEMAEQQEA